MTAGVGAAGVTSRGVTLIDGRSGSGKTTLADRLAAGSGAAILHLDELYPGWDGLAEGSRSVARALRAGEYLRYDWEAGAFSERVVLDPARPLVIEGCGALTLANLAAARAWARGSGAVRTIWMECPDELRRDRALARDGEMFRPHWERWAAQEEAHFAAERPVALAAEIVHADPSPAGADPVHQSAG